MARGRARAKGKWTVKPLQGRMVQLRHHLSDFAPDQGKAFAEQLSDNVARGNRSGPIYYQYGRVYPASAPGEYPQEQTGNLRSSVGVQTVDGNITQVRAGFFADLANNPGELKRYLAEIEGYPIGAATGASRHALRMTGDDPKTLQAVVEAALDWVSRNK